MTRLPQLEAQLVAAAAGRRPRARRPLLLAAGALTVAACVIVALVLISNGEPQRHERPVTVPETVPASTLVKARALAAMPKPRHFKVPADQLSAAAKRIMAQTPYPPGLSDKYDFERRRPVRAETNQDIQGLVEYHAYCLWMIYWARGVDRASAKTVLQLTPQWPTRRGANGHLTGWQHKIQLALRQNNVAVLKAEARSCASAAKPR